MPHCTVAHGPVYTPPPTYPFIIYLCLPVLPFPTVDTLPLMAFVHLPNLSSLAVLSPASTPTTGQPPRLGHLLV